MNYVVYFSKVMQRGNKFFAFLLFGGMGLETVYDICRLQTADRRLQTADCRLQTADCMRQQDYKLNETKNIVIRVASSSTLPCSEKYM